MKRSFHCRIVGNVLLLLVAAQSDVAAEDYMTPTAQHEALQHDVGVWDAEVTMWMTADAEPTKSKAVETNEMLGKMWIMGKFEGELGGQPYTGRSAVGYDPIKKKYYGGWVDTMSPFMWRMEGEYDEDSRTLTMMGEGIDCMTGKPFKGKMITRYEGDDAKVFEMHHPVEGEEGKWWKSMEARYTRRK
jgi:hypothetical protein